MTCIGCKYYYQQNLKAKPKCTLKDSLTGRRCQHYFNEREMTDATKIQKDSVIITEERYFELLRKEELLRVKDADDTLVMLAEAGDLLSYVTYHDNRYSQADNYEKFLQPAGRLYGRICRILGQKPYEKLLGTVVGAK